MKRVFLLTLLTPLFAILKAQTPSFEWANSAGSAGFEVGYNITTDAVGNVYTTGVFENTVDFDPGPGVMNLTSAGGNDIFIQKLDPNGDLVWVRSIGADGNDLGRAITVDGSGEIYVSGYFQNVVDFDPGPGIFNLTAVGGDDVFILKLDPNGDFVWSQSMGGTGSDQCVTITTGPSGSVYTTGTFQNTVDFDPGPSVFNLTSAGSNDIFIQKLDANGSFLWAKSVGFLGLDWGYSIATDNMGGFYITGIFQNTIDFDPGPGVFNLTAVGGLDAYILKLDALGDFMWATSVGGTGTVISFSIAIDASSHVYTTGFFQNTIDFDPGPGVVNLTSNGAEDCFIQKLDADGNFIWVNSFGAVGTDLSVAITTDAFDNVYTTGSFQNTVDFDPSAGGTSNLTSAGSDDMFIQKLDPDGNFLWANGAGNTLNESGVSIAVDMFNNVFTTGSFQGTVDFDPTAGVLNLTSAGGDDYYLQKLSQCVTEFGVDTRVECDSLLWINGITYYASNNSATDTIFGGSSNGCDSVVTLDLTINTTPVVDPVSNVNACDGSLVSGSSFTSNPAGASFTWTNDNASIGLGLTGSNNYSSFTAANAGVANISFTPTLNGCIGNPGSYMISIDTIATSTDTHIACDSLVWIDGITYYTDNNTASHTISNGAFNGCDSIITLNLTINDSTTNHIEGVVYYQGTPITTGEVTLLKKDGVTPQDIFQVDSVFVNGVGYYSFNDLTPGDYIIKALGDTTLYNNASTYVGDINYWQWAQVKTISFGCNDTLFNVDINLIDFPDPSGTGSISGTIKENGGPIFKGPGEPIPDIDITVEQSPSGAISGVDISDGNGEFNFDNLAPGNYYIYADIPGYVCDTTYIINFDGSGLNYEVDICVYDTVNTIEVCKSIVTSVEKYNSAGNIKIYPNPSNGQMTIEVEGEDNYTIEITDLTGKLIDRYMSTNFLKRINLSHFDKGIYILNILIDNEKYSNKLIIQ